VARLEKIWGGKIQRLRGEVNNVVMREEEVER
jgi:hypothetical protein